MKELFYGTVIILPCFVHPLLFINMALFHPSMVYDRSLSTFWGRNAISARRHPLLRSCICYMYNISLTLQLSGLA